MMMGREQNLGEYSIIIKKKENTRSGITV